MYSNLLLFNVARDQTYAKHQQGYGDGHVILRIGQFSRFGKEKETVWGSTRPRIAVPGDITACEPSTIAQPPTHYQQNESFGNQSPIAHVFFLVVYAPLDVPVRLDSSSHFYQIV